MDNLIKQHEKATDILMMLRYANKRIENYDDAIKTFKWLSSWNKVKEYEHKKEITQMAIVRIKAYYNNMIIKLHL
jgi:hypothetical protein